MMVLYVSRDTDSALNLNIIVQCNEGFSNFPGHWNDSIAIPT